MNLKGTKTENNLKCAFSGECEARCRYDFFSAIAKNEGYEQISEIFKITANNELAHAKIWYDILSPKENTEENLRKSAKDESYEWQQMYANFAKDARDEGFNEIAEKFEKIANIEHSHDDRYTNLLNNISNKNVFEKQSPSDWICRNCGFEFTGAQTPESCPVCNHPQSYFELKAENY